MAKRKGLHDKQTTINQFWEANLYKGMPMVHTTDGYIVPWNKNMIVEQLHRETQLADIVFSIEPISSGYANKIAGEVERRVKLTKPKFANKAYTSNHGRRSIYLPGIVRVI